MIALLALAGCRVPDTLPLPTVPSRAPSVVPATPSVVETPDASPSRAPLLLAHVMPWYQTPSVSGYWGWHWTMDHFDPGQVDAEGRPSIASYYFPLTGPYDSADDDLVEYQVLLMKLAGIDGVIVDWYGMEDFRDYAVLNVSTHKLFAAIQRAGLRFAICYEDQTVRHMVDHGYLQTQDVYTHGQAVMRYLQDTWFGADAYLKVEGRPALFVFGPQYYTNALNWEELFSVLETRPALVTLDGHTESAGVASYPWPPMWAGQDGVLSQEALEGYLAGFYTKAQRWELLVAGAFPGFRDIYAEAGVATESRYLDPLQGETFRYTLQLALEQKPDIIQLITWNDYGESTAIEPTEEYGYLYLEMIQEVQRAGDGGGFPFTAEDLRVPLQLYRLRKQHPNDAAINTRLGTASDALIAGDVNLARTILASLSNVP